MEKGGPGGPWPFLNFKPALHRNSIFAIEKSNFSKWPSQLSVTSSASNVCACVRLCLVYVYMCFSDVRYTYVI